MTLFQNLKHSAERQTIQIEPIPSDVLTTEEKNDLLRIVARIRDRIRERTDFWQVLTHHYGPLE